MFTNCKTGWIGIDVGSSSIKAAQVARGRGGLKVVASAIVPRTPCWELPKLKEGPLSSANELRCAIDLDRSFCGRKVAATLPMEVCDYFQIEGTFESLAANHQAARRALETLIQRSAANLQFDFWPAESPLNGRKTPRCHLMAVDRRWSDQLADDLLQNGWSCQVIDGLPHALARAMLLSSPELAGKPVAALDWGYGQATFCVVQQGKPVYTRVLKGCRLKSVIDVLIESLDVTVDEAHQLLLQVGVSSKRTAPENDCQRFISNLVAPSIAQVARELDRTLTHVKQQLPQSSPQRLVLFGGGALLKGGADQLAHRLDMPTQVWKLPSASETPCPHACLLGPALALSALAWEKTA